MFTSENYQCSLQTKISHPKAPYFHGISNKITPLKKEGVWSSKWNTRLPLRRPTRVCGLGSLEITPNIEHSSTLNVHNKHGTISTSGKYGRHVVFGTAWTSRASLH